MRVATVQFNPKFGEIDENIACATSLISRSGADLFVLPELCFSGYAFRSASEVIDLSESTKGGYSIGRMSELSSKLNAAIVFGFPEKTRDGLYNSCAFVAPDGHVEIYRKLHLYYNEKDYFLPGDKPPKIIQFRGCWVGMMICFDWIFPETARTLALKGAQIICHPANLVMPYCQSAMITRCLENRIFAITANRIGEENRGGQTNRFTGESQIISPKGIVLYRATNNKDEFGFADIDYRESDDKAVNEKNNLWEDRRPAFYS
jgi:predicted amidohydrolase